MPGGVTSMGVPLTPGDQLGPYEILGPWGAGGMGEVYRAHDTKLNRDVAIKVLPAGLGNDAGYLARFQREAQALAALHHPNIATIFWPRAERHCDGVGRRPKSQGPLAVDGSAEHRAPDRRGAGSGASIRLAER